MVDAKDLYQRPAAARSEMRVELDAGRIPVQRRKVVRAFLDGSDSEFVAAAERWEQRCSAGANVVPAVFRNRAATV